MRPYAEMTLYPSERGRSVFTRVVNVKVTQETVESEIPLALRGADGDQELEGRVSSTFVESLASDGNRARYRALMDQLWTKPPTNAQGWLVVAEEQTGDCLVSLRSFKDGDLRVSIRVGDAESCLSVTLDELGIWANDVAEVLGVAQLLSETMGEIA